MKAEILAVGSELLAPGRVETNASTIGARLREIGVDVIARITVADDAALLESAFRNALGRADVVIATGGLGPTEDDLTREAAAAALGLPLRRDEELLAALRARFARYNRVMAPVNEKQADLIEGARVLPNPRGTANGQILEAGARTLVLLPGPPFEMQPMLEEHVLPALAGRGGGRVLRTRILRIAAMGESDVEQLAAPVYKAFANPRTTILGGAAQTELHLTAEDASGEAAEARIEELAGRLRAVLPGRIYSEDGRELNEVVAGLLRERGLTLALAESCTGGMLAASLTEVPGSSAFFRYGWVTYANEAKASELGVEPALLERVGAVSEEVAAAMARGARERARADVAVAVTGIAGPGGGSEEKPVGLAFVAMDGALGTRVRRCRFIAERPRVRQQAVRTALEMMRRGLLGLPPL